MYTGVIARPLHEKGFCFIRPDGGGEEVFMHVSGLADGMRQDEIVPGIRVSYELGSGTRGRTQAVGVRLLSDRDLTYIESSGGSDAGSPTWQEAIAEVVQRHSAAMVAELVQLLGDS